jgi:branched-chain amino acid transport system permease protein
MRLYFSPTIFATLIAVVALLIIPWLDRYATYLLVSVAIAAIGALALNLLTGMCGLISFSQGALLGVGAYTAGNLGNAGWDILALPAAGLVTAIVSLVIGLPALRLRGLYFGVATLAAQFILEYLFKILDPLTHGVSGLPIRPLVVLGVTIQNDRMFATICVLSLLLAWLAISYVRKTDLGRSFLVVRESEIVAKGMGIDVVRTKVWAFLISGFVAGIAGALLGFNARLANPEAFTLALSVDYVAMIIVGGLGSLGGSLLGSLFVVLLPEVIQRVAEAFDIASLLSSLRELAFGALIIVFLIFEPRGLSALMGRLKLQLRNAIGRSLQHKKS